MAQTVDLWGATYSNVPYIKVPSGNGTAQFDDTTIASNAASASDITSGKLAFVNGELVTGTASGGGATLITKSITANGTYNASSDNADGYSSVTVNVSGGGGGGGDMSDPIRFFDYDGTLVASYSAVPDSLPDCPTHSGLTSQGWNWTLSEIQTQFSAMGFCDVGHNLVTSDGKTRIYIELVEGRTTPYFGCCPNGTVTIDWGDNSGTDTLTGTSLTSAKHKQHSYAEPGKYVISVEATSGTFALYGTTNNAYILSKTGGSLSSVNSVYNAAVQKVELGAGVSLGNCAFSGCTRLESVSIPTNITTTGTQVFYTTYNLRFVVYPRGTTTINSSVISPYKLMGVSFPAGVTSIAVAFASMSAVKRLVVPSAVVSLASSAFSGLHSAQSFIIPPNITSIPSSMLSSCRAIASLEIPASVTEIGASAFSGCYGMKEYHFKPTTPPTLANTNAFSNIQSDCVIYVPAASLDTYKTANNWSTYASKMVGE